MTAEPVVRCGAALVVFEGPSRIVWSDTGDGGWTPRELWPQRSQRRQLREHLDGGFPLLVVIDDPSVTVPILRDEWDRAPEALRAALACPRPSCPLSIDAAVSGGSEVTEGATREILEFSLPFLDWLPEVDRRRGVEFFAHTRETLARVPAALLPPLLLDRPARQPVPKVRFARRLLPGALTPSRLDVVVRHIFAPDGAGATVTATAGQGPTAGRTTRDDTGHNGVGDRGGDGGRPAPGHHRNEPTGAGR